MLFHTPPFFVFLAVVLAAFYCLGMRWGRWLLLLASYFFYAWWNPKFLPLLWTLTLLDYGAALWITRPGATHRKAALVVSIAANLGFLGFFKYYNFFAAELAHWMSLPPQSFLLAIVLPIGISFHTFQSISYVVDVYRGEQKPVRNLVDYALFVAFFPQLVAGPIVRARDFFRDLYQWRPATREDALRGTLIFLLGMTKKVALADQFAQISDAYFKDPGAQAGVLPAWSAAFAFAMQIFFDFSGYTDMAIGVAKLFGFHFPENFRRPYLALSITGFWRRWHMSLSTWLRDYLYISLGGSRHGAWKTYRNLFLTMLLGGLWHGASWNFVIWGGYHGVLLALERKTGREPGWVITFLLVCVGWVWFRAATFSGAMHVLGQMFHGSAWGRWQVPVWLLLLTALAFVAALLEEHSAWFDRLALAPAWRYVAACAALLAAIELFGLTEVPAPFVYFQF